MSQKEEIDDLDRKILSILLKDARTPYLDIARELIVSGATIHVRMNKLKKMGIVKGSKLVLDYAKLGYGVQVFLGINLIKAGDYNEILSLLESFPEVIEAHYTTGQYSIFVKVLVKDISALHLFLTQKLQPLKGIQSTETIISLDVPISKEPL